MIDIFSMGSSVRDSSGISGARSGVKPSDNGLDEVRGETDSALGLNPDIVPDVVAKSPTQGVFCFSQKTSWGTAKKI